MQSSCRTRIVPSWCIGGAGLGGGQSSIEGLSPEHRPRREVDGLVAGMASPKCAGAPRAHAGTLTWLRAALPAVSVAGGAAGPGEF